MHVNGSGAWLPGQDCLLCGAGGPSGLLCDPCGRDLPRPSAACLRCAATLPAPGVCGDCLAHPPSFDAAVAAFEYRYPLDRMVLRFKFGADLAIGRWLALRLAERLEAQSADVVVVPPIARERLRVRGFNPALEIARALAKRRRLPLEWRGVVRLRETWPQPGLGRRERRRNLQGAFACGFEARGCRVAIVDDVMTTGATADAIASALKDAGAAWVGVWAVARTPDPASRGA